jgi:hypothetical protein
VENNPLTRIDPSGHTWTWALNSISTVYNSGMVADWEASAMIFGANSISFTLGEKGKNRKEPFSQLFTPFHEIAQINIAKELYKKYGESPELEKSLIGTIDGKKKKYEADIVLGNKVWEVKPLNSADPKPELELYKTLGGLTEGERLNDKSRVSSTQ